MKITYRLHQDNHWNEVIACRIPGDSMPTYWVSPYDLESVLEQWLGVLANVGHDPVTAYPHYQQCGRADCERCNLIRIQAVAFVNRFGPGDLETLPMLGGRIVRGYVMNGAFGSAESRTRQVPLELFLWAAHLLACQWDQVHMIHKTDDRDQRYRLIEQLVGMDDEERARWRALSRVAVRRLRITASAGPAEDGHYTDRDPEFFWQWPAILDQMAVDLSHPPYRVRDWFLAQAPKISNEVDQGSLSQAEGERLTATLEQALTLEGGGSTPEYDVRDNAINLALAQAGWALQAKVGEGWASALAEMEVETTGLWQRVEGEFVRQLVIGHGTPQVCEHCARPFIQHHMQAGRPRRFCTHVCRLAWYRQKA